MVVQLMDLFNKTLLSTYFATYIALRTTDLAVNKTSKAFTLQSLTLKLHPKRQTIRQEIRKEKKHR